MTERNISCFFVKELLPLYLEDKIDAKRRGEIKSHLAICQQCNHYYEKLISARNALFELSKTKVSPGIINYLKEEHTFWTELYIKIKWNKWPNSLKWGVELAVVTLVLVFTIHIFPWLRFVRAVGRLQPQAPVMTTVKNPEIPFTPTPSLALAVAKNEVASPKSSGAPAPTAIATQKPVQVAAVQSPLAEEADTGKADQKSDGQETQVSGQTDENTNPKNEQGYVWRGTLQVDEVSDELTDRVTSTITELGGTKAGEVELGWHRGNQRYYHFILPEENYEKLLSVLNSEGLVELKKVRHPRVMKSGYMRIIMTVEESPE